MKGKEVATLKAAREAVAEVRPGDEVPVVLIRDGKTLDLTLTAGEGL